MWNPSTGPSAIVNNVTILHFYHIVHENLVSWHYDMYLSLDERLVLLYHCLTRYHWQLRDVSGTVSSLFFRVDKRNIFFPIACSKKFLKRIEHRVIHETQFWCPDPLPTVIQVRNDCRRRVWAARLLNTCLRHNKILKILLMIKNALEYHGAIPGCLVVTLIYVTIKKHCAPVLGHHNCQSLEETARGWRRLRGAFTLPVPN